MPKFVLRAVLGRMQFTLRATRRTSHGASRSVQATSAWLMKTRRAPSRHSRGARVYGHTTTAMHKLSTPPPPAVSWNSIKTVVRVRGDLCVWKRAYRVRASWLLSGGRATAVATLP